MAPDCAASMSSPCHKPRIEDGGSDDDTVSINSVLTDDGLRTVLSKLEKQSDKDSYSLVCKRWLMLQSSERRRVAARAGSHMLQKLAFRFTCLVELDFSQDKCRSFYPGVSDSDLHIIATHFQSLERINLQECKGISDAGVAALAGGLPGLRWVVLSDCKKISDRGIDALAGSCPKLLTLLIARCKLITDKALEALARSCRDLEQLDVSSCFCITDKGIEALSKGCFKLQVLEFSKCTKLGDAGVSSIVESPLHESLRSLSLLDCCKVTDKSISLLAQRCTRLQTLLLGGCRLLTDASLTALATECGCTLRELVLDWCSEVGDAGVAAVLSHCSSLERLHVQNCKLVTDRAFDGLQRLLELKVVKLNHSSVTERARWKIAACCPDALVYL